MPQSTIQPVAVDISSVMDSGLDVAPSVHSVAVMTTDAQSGNALHWAVARVAKLMGRHDIHKAETLPQDAVLAIQELDMHVVHVENVRALAEDVIIRWGPCYYSEIVCVTSIA